TTAVIVTQLKYHHTYHGLRITIPYKDDVENQPAALSRVARPPVIAQPPIVLGIEAVADLDAVRRGLGESARKFLTEVTGVGDDEIGQSNDHPLEPPLDAITKGRVSQAERVGHPGVAEVGDQRPPGQAFERAADQVGRPRPTAGAQDVDALPAHD